MTPDILRDYADNVAREFPELIDPIRYHPSLYSGKGNLCTQVIIALEQQVPGLTRDQRLAFIAWIFQLPLLLTMKDLTGAQLRTLATYHEYLGALHAES